MRNLFKVVLTLAVAGGFSSSALAQTYAGWDAAGRPLGSSAQAPGARLGGTVTLFATRAEWTTATGVAAVETFDGGATPNASVATCGATVSSASNDACFTPGQLSGGFSVSSSGTALVVLGTGFLGAGQTSDVIGSNEFTAFTTVNFDAAQNVRSVAMDGLIGNAPTGTIDVRVFDTVGTLVDTFSVATVAQDAASFIGFVSPVSVGRVELQGAADSGELLDNLSFGTGGGLPPPVARPAVIPTASTSGLALLIGLLGVAGLLAVRRRF